MNKLNQLLLEDYLKDSSDLRLSLFCRAINPSFNLGKKDREKIRLLIEDFKQDRENKNRIKAIENFLSGETKPPKSAGKTKTNKLTALLKETPETLELKELQTKYISALRRMDYKTADEVKPLITAIETRLGFMNSDYKYTASDIKENHLSLITNILGDYETEGTVAWKCLDGNSNQAQLGFSSHISAKLLLKWLQEYSGKKIRKFKITDYTNGFAPGQQVGNVKNGTYYILTDAISGVSIAPPIGSGDSNTVNALTPQAQSEMLKQHTETN